MAHKHDHEDHGNHHHNHDHDNEQTSEMAFDQKMEKLLAHWIKHNKDHAQTYRRWAERARQEGMAELAGLIEKAAKTGESVDAVLQDARMVLAKKR